MKTYELIGFNNDINLQSINYPLYVYIELTDSCNFNCKFCSINKKNKNFKVKSDKSTLKFFV